MGYYALSIEKLIEEFRKMPGIGYKSAQRLAFHILEFSNEEAENFIKTVADAKNNISLCEKCCNLTDINPCAVCSDKTRNKSVICVVETPADVIAMEKTNGYKGLYHVLHGVISPMNGVKPDDIKIKELISRLNDDVKEVIIATNPNVEGEATGSYIARLISPLGIKVTRIAKGIPIGGDIEYADEVTLIKALENRMEI